MASQIRVSAEAVQVPEIASKPGKKQACPPAPRSSGKNGHKNAPNMRPHLNRCKKLRKKVKLNVTQTILEERWKS